MRIFHISVPLVCLIYHFILVVITIVNYVVFARLQQTPAELRGAYLAFSAIEAVAFGGFGGPLFVYAYKYGKTSTARIGRLLCGVSIMFLFSSLPMLIIELVQLLSFNGELRHALDGTVFLLHGIAAAFGGCTAWFAYMRVVARHLQSWRGPERQIVDDSDNFRSREVQLRLVKRSQQQPETI
ncbi:hypothetical protein NESM_000693400 [Novymonas esmeraldas]|uniref:Uncharacterized protein n=1 Tax=Novymonas esmeraldas TaxID=1808958 RepID=A0AAW0EXE2_9TRYP